MVSSKKLGFLFGYIGLFSGLIFSLFFVYESNSANEMLPLDIGLYFGVIGIILGSVLSYFGCISSKVVLKV